MCGNFGKIHFLARMQDTNPKIPNPNHTKTSITIINPPIITSQGKKLSEANVQVCTKMTLKKKNEFRVGGGQSQSAFGNFGKVRLEISVNAAPRSDVFPLHHTDGNDYCG